MHQTPNVKIVNKHRETAGAWFCETTDVDRWRYVIKDVRALQVIEPDHDWHIETTGEFGTWHRVPLFMFHNIEVIRHPRLMRNFNPD